MGLSPCEPQHFTLTEVLVSEPLKLVPTMSANYDDIISNLTVSSSPPWSDTNETVRGSRETYACFDWR